MNDPEELKRLREFMTGWQAALMRADKKLLDHYKALDKKQPRGLGAELVEATRGLRTLEEVERAIDETVERLIAQAGPLPS